MPAAQFSKFHQFIMEYNESIGFVPEIFIFLQHIFEKWALLKLCRPPVCLCVISHFFFQKFVPRLQPTP
jgi:hypothetical protein